MLPAIAGGNSAFPARAFITADRHLLPHRSLLEACLPSLLIETYWLHLLGVLLVARSCAGAVGALPWSLWYARLGKLIRRGAANLVHRSVDFLLLAGTTTIQFCFSLLCEHHPRVPSNITEPAAVSCASNPTIASHHPGHSSTHVKPSPIAALSKQFLKYIASQVAFPHRSTHLLLDQTRATGISELAKLCLRSLRSRYMSFADISGTRAYTKHVFAGRWPSISALNS
jgi:hypothetical protein